MHTHTPGDVVDVMVAKHANWFAHSKQAHVHNAFQRAVQLEAPTAASNDVFVCAVCVSVADFQSASLSYCAVIVE